MVLKSDLNFFFFVTAFAQAKSLSVDVLVLPLDVTDHDNHKNHTQAVINHFHKVGICNLDTLIIKHYVSDNLFLFKINFQYK